MLYSTSLCRLQSLHTIDACHGKFPNRDRSNILYLLHLQRRVIPNASTEAPRQLKGITDSHRVLQVNLTIDDTSNEAVNMRKNDCFVNLILSLVLAEMFVDWKVYAP